MPNSASTETLKTQLVSPAAPDNAIQAITDLNEYRFYLSNSLQNSLDIKDTLTSFYKLLQKAVPIAGMDYQFSQKNIRHAFGAQRTHKIRYNLKAGEIAIGEIVFSRGKRFSVGEITTVESLLGVLVLPLRNALMYRDALENSLRDPLTGIGNRAALELVLQREHSLTKRNNQPLTIIIGDLDHFKRVNDNHGHAVGDQLLKQTANIMQAALRQSDQVFRFGGEEFVIVLGGTHHQHGLYVAERIRQQLAATPMLSNSDALHVTISLGVSSCRDADSREDLLERADQALYRAKSQGRNRVVSEEFVAATPPGQAAIALN